MLISHTHAILSKLRLGNISDILHIHVSGVVTLWKKYGLQGLVVGNFLLKSKVKKSNESVIRISLDCHCH